MKTLWPWLVLAVCPLLPWGTTLRSAPEARTERHRSPIDVALLPGGRLAITANHTSDSASLVDLNAGKVLAELPCGAKPAGVACSTDGRRAAVSNLWSGTVTLLDVDAATLRPAGTVTVGSQPRGIIFAPDGTSLYVALAGAGEVVQIAWPTGKVQQRWAAPGEPRRVVLTRDGRFLAAISARSAEVRCWDTTSRKLLWERALHDAFNLHGLTLAPDGKQLVTAQAHTRHHPIVKNMIEQGWALNSRLGRLPLEPDGRTPYWQINLDLRGRAVGDPCAAAFSAEGTWLAIAAAGTQELLVFRASAIPWNGGEPGDFLDSTLDAGGPDKFQRVPLGGRPVTVQFIDKSQVVVANYLSDAVQVVNAVAGTIVRTIPLGGPKEQSLVRRGEAIFYDAKRSHHQWFSCHSCHPDGHTNSRNFDTLNDDSTGNAKLTPTLRGVARTGPYTWHGWQDRLTASVEKSLIDTLHGPKPTDDDVQALTAFLATLDHPPSPHRRADGSRSVAVERGHALFHGKARCARCHQGDDFTTARNYDVKLDADGSPFDFWNPPSLRGLYDRGPFLHDGRAESLDDVLRIHHAPEKLGGAALTDGERAELIDYLKAL